MTAFTPHWGIIGTGWISLKFATDLCLPEPRDGEVDHVIAAVGSRTADKAKEFIREHCPRGCKGQMTAPLALSYEEVYSQPSVNIVYIGTPNPMHYENVKAVIRAGKHCLVEKPAVLNAGQWESLCKLAKEKGVFLMEGMWTRFLPLVKELRSALSRGLIGEVKGVHSDFSMNRFAIHTPDDRFFNPKLAGGAWLDLGPYIMLYPLIALYTEGEDVSITSAGLKAPTGVDLATSFIMTFPKRGAIATATTSFAYNGPRNDKCVISGTQGEIVIHDGLSRVTKMTIKRLSPSNAIPFRPVDWEPDMTVESPIAGWGLAYEADAVAKALSAGHLEHPEMTHKDTLMSMQLLDTVRRQTGLDYVDDL